MCVSRNWCGGIVSELSVCMYDGMRGGGGSFVVGLDWSAFCVCVALWNY